jgi:hypothetical protein
MLRITARLRFRLGPLGQSEVEHFDHALWCDLDVGRLQIAVYDPLFVRRFQGVGDLARQHERLLEGDRALPDAFGQGLAFYQFHH